MEVAEAPSTVGGGLGPSFWRDSLAPSPIRPRAPSALRYLSIHARARVGEP